MTAPSDEVGHPPPGIEGSRTDAPQQFDARRIPLLLWAKLGKASKGELAEPLPYHPLLCHCLDVAAVAEALWRECLAPAARHWLAGGLGLDDEEAGRWVAFLAGLHDVGKCAPAFQFQFRREAVRRLLRPRARAAGLDWHPGVEGQNRP